MTVPEIILPIHFDRPWMQALERDQRGATGWWLYSGNGLEGQPQRRSAIPMAQVGPVSEATTRVGFTYDPRDVVTWVEDGVLPGELP